MYMPSGMHGIVTNEIFYEMRNSPNSDLLPNIYGLFFLICKKIIYFLFLHKQRFCKIFLSVLLLVINFLFWIFIFIMIIILIVKWAGQVRIS
mgnify:CR=1 FL=1